MSKGNDMKEHQKILEMSVENRLPKTIDNRTNLSLDIVQELVEGGYLKAIDASSLDGIAYLNPKITLSGRKFLEQLRLREGSNAENMSTNNIRLFISHSANDHDFVERVVELLRSALALSASQIRCTSVDGYRLPGGSNTNERLRQEVHDADAFIGVISSNSLRSLYVAFELGARWGAGLTLIPLLAPGTDPSVLGGPLGGLNALSAASRPQLHQLISELSRGLGIKSEDPAVYERYMVLVIEFKKSDPYIVNEHHPESCPGTLLPKCL